MDGHLTTATGATISQAGRPGTGVPQEDALAVVVQRVVDRSAQGAIEQLEIEYFRWVSAELGTEFGIRLDVEGMIARDLSELEVYLPPRGALFVAADGADLVGMIFLGPIRADTAQIRRVYVHPGHR